MSTGPRRRIPTKPAIDTVTPPSPHRHPTVTPVPQAIRDAYEIKDDSPCRKYLNGKGLPILASDKVDDRALFEAGDIISNMR